MKEERDKQVCPLVWLPEAQLDPIVDQIEGLPLKSSIPLQVLSLSLSFLICLLTLSPNNPILSEMVAFPLLLIIHYDQFETRFARLISGLNSVLPFIAREDLPSKHNCVGSLLGEF